MSTYPVHDLLHKWERGELTAEQVAGQLLLHLLLIEQRLAAVEKRLHQVEQSPVKLSI